jgi:chromosomal replication initiation ATPase DnaA
MNAPIGLPRLDSLPVIPLRDPEVGLILEVVAKAYSVTPDMITGSRKNGRLAEARQLAIWAMKTRTDMSVSAIAESVGKDWSSVSHAVKRLGLRRAREPRLDAFCEQLAAAIDARLELIP